jgi:hypothetical protein
MNVDILVSEEHVRQQKPPPKGDMATLLDFLIMIHFPTLELICIIT